MIGCTFVTKKFLFAFVSKKADHKKNVSFCCKSKAHLSWESFSFLKGIVCYRKLSLAGRYIHSWIRKNSPVKIKVMKTHIFEDNYFINNIFTQMVLRFLKKGSIIICMKKFFVFLLEEVSNTGRVCRKMMQDAVFTKKNLQMEGQ